jgi:hypothetical protein
VPSLCVAPLSASGARASDSVPEGRKADDDGGVCLGTEELKDLLAPARIGSSGAASGGQGLSSQGLSSAGALAGRGRGLSIREDADGGIYFAGAEEAEVVSFEDARTLLEQGTARRAVGSTEMNTHSSRSHAIFTLTIEQRVVGDAEPEPGTAGDVALSEVAVGCEEEYITSKFHFVDLAGSERLKKTKAEGERLKEGININSGLLALGNVISALGDETRMRQGAHVPYRDSKLTRMLQDSLGGNSRTLMIACVSPVDSNSEESKSTLQYANRARNIKNKPVINRDPHSHLIAQLRKEVAGLRSLLHQNGIYASLSALPSAPAPAPAPAAPASPSREGPSLGEGSARAREASLREQLVRFEVQVAEQAALIDDLKLGMAQMYTSATAMQEEMHAMRANLANPHALEEALTAMERLVASIHNIEEQCRTKVVKHAACMPAAGNVSVMSSSGDKSARLEGPYSARQEGPAIFRRLSSRPSSGGSSLWSPRDGAASGGADGSLPLSRQGTPGGGGGALTVPPLALEGLRQLNCTGDEGDECMATDRTDRTDGASRQLMSDAMREMVLCEGMRDMDAVLLEKERLLHELVRNQRDFDTMRNAYERKMQHLQLSIRAIEEERDQTAKELESLDQRPALTSRTSEDKERQRVRLRQLEEELRKLRKKVKDHERLLSFKEQGDQKIAKLSQEVEQLKTTRMQLHKKMAREAKGFREHKQELEKQIVTLRKADMSSRKVILELQTKLSSKERGEHVQRRRAQTAMEKKKLSLEKEKEVDWGKALARGKALDVDDVDVVLWLHEQLAQASRKETARLELETSTTFRQQLDTHLGDSLSKLACLERELAGGSSKDRSVGERELQDLRDETEYLMAEADFRAVELERAKKHLADAEKAEREMPDVLAHMSELQVRRLATACYEDCVQSRINLQKKTHRLHESEVSLLDARRSLQEASLQALALREAHDSEKTKIEQLYEEKLAFLMQHLQEEQAHLKSPLLHATSAYQTPRAVLGIPPFGANSPTGAGGSGDPLALPLAHPHTPVAPLAKKGPHPGAVSPLSPTSSDPSAGASSARRNPFQVANVFQQQQLQQQLQLHQNQQLQQQEEEDATREHKEDTWREHKQDTSGEHGEDIPVQWKQDSRVGAGARSARPSTSGARAGVPTLPIGDMDSGGDMDAGDAQHNSARQSAWSARESSSWHDPAGDGDAARLVSRSVRETRLVSRTVSIRPSPSFYPPTASPPPPPSPRSLPSAGNGRTPRLGAQSGLGLPARVGGQIEAARGDRSSKAVCFCVGAPRWHCPTCVQRAACGGHACHGPPSMQPMVGKAAMEAMLPMPAMAWCACVVCCLRQRLGLPHVSGWACLRVYMATLGNSCLFARVYGNYCVFVHVATCLRMWQLSLF